MAVYFIANIRINDPEGYKLYLASVDEIFSKYNGEYLAVDGAPVVLEGKWDYTKAVLIRFSTKADFEEWYRSPEYQEILKYRLSAAECDTILIDGK